MRHHTLHNWLYSSIHTYHCSLGKVAAGTVVGAGAVSAGTVVGAGTVAGAGAVSAGTVAAVL